MENNISNSVQNQLRQMQQFEVQLEDTASQKYQLEMKSREIDKTLEELEGLGDSPALYKIVGNILYKVENKSKLVDDLKEQKELSQIRIKTLERQQKTLEEKLNELDQSMKKSYEEMKKRTPQ